MQKHPTIDKKLVDWVSTFNSMPNPQTNEAQILKDLILKIQAKTRKEVISSASS
ncbi:MAG: hypothetical protein P8X83_08130 [Nitrosopumilaceae archaeon]